MGTFGVPRIYLDWESVSHTMPCGGSGPKSPTRGAGVKGQRGKADRFCVSVGKTFPTSVLGSFGRYYHALAVLSCFDKQEPTVKRFLGTVHPQGG
eukprot:9487111-Pyramimonas_sp.AAC.1